MCTLRREKELQGLESFCDSCHLFVGEGNTIGHGDLLILAKVF